MSGYSHVCLWFVVNNTPAYTQYPSSFIARHSKSVCCDVSVGLQVYCENFLI